MKSIRSTTLLLALSGFLLLFGNFRFFSNVLQTYPLNGENLLFLLSLALVFGCINLMILTLLSVKYLIKPALILLLLASASAAYFMDSYNVIIDDVMVGNLLKTDMAEARDLLSGKQILYLTLLGLLPAILIYRVRIVFPPFKKALLRHGSLFVAAALIALSSIFVLGDFYASFIREHKVLRFYANPSYYLYSLTKYLTRSPAGPSLALREIGLDARIPAYDQHRELVILVVGETARADHFSLNGYQKKTNPMLEQEKVYSFTDFWACGTSTAVSVPCMFSLYGHDTYREDTAASTENVLDILQHAGTHVLWLDNNSDSKGVATRIPYESYKSSDKNPVCDSECRDVGMLSRLQRYIDEQASGDIFIVLHQMGNHGPAYYKRYPPRFETFTPTCNTNQLESCDSEAINNAYDNAILYTDFFLAKTIELLKQYDGPFETSMIYVSDHGESLGENGVYLHGLPYMIAPDTQTHVPMIMWFGEHFDPGEINFETLQAKTRKKFSHDNVFHTLLGLLEIDTALYDVKMDIIDHGQTE